MNQLSVRKAVSNVEIVTSGYSDRYPMCHHWNIHIDIDRIDADGDEVTNHLVLSAYSWENAVDQLTVLAEVMHCPTSRAEFSQQIRKTHQVLLPYRDGSMCSTVKTSSDHISDAIAYYSTGLKEKYSQTGVERITESVKLVSREELLGIKQQMDKINILIGAGMMRGEIVEFTWQDVAIEEKIEDENNFDMS